MVTSVSIIIPVFNVAPYITQCIHSVMNQTFSGPLECIIVDDCSTDNSMEIVNGLISHYNGGISFKVICHARNRGLSAARNTGIAASTGDYVCFLDSDDWITEDCIYTLTAPLKEQAYDMVVGDYQMTGGATPPKALLLTKTEGRHDTPVVPDTTLCNSGVYVMGVNKLFNASFLRDNQLKFKEGLLHEDELFTFELAVLINNYFVVKHTTYYYRIHDNSITTRVSVGYKKLDAFVLILREIQQLVYNRYSKVAGIYDYYMFWIKRVFNRFSENIADEEQLQYIQKRTAGYLNIIPGIRHLKEKNNRLLYFLCKTDQTYSRYQDVSKRVRYQWYARAIKKVLSYIPEA